MHAIRMVVLAVLPALCWACGPRPCQDTSTNPAPPVSRPDTPEAPNALDKIVIVVSVDGMMPATYMDPDRHGLKVPTLRALKQNGAYSPRVQSVFPSVTYPAHTTIVTGAQPGVHGITNNRTWDPLARNQGGWYWYADDIQVPTVWQVAHKAGIRTALINWPVTVGADVTYLVAEYWRAGTADDVKLYRALATPGLLDKVGERFKDFWTRLTPPDVPDSVSMDIAIHLIENDAPQLMYIHIWMVDEYQHRDGPWSDEAKVAIEEADTQIGRLIQALEQAGLWSRTTLVVLSDHGFLAIEHRIKAGVILAGLGLVTLNEKGAPTEWKAVARADGGMAYVYVKDAGDAATKKALRDTLSARTGQAGSGIGRIYSREEIQARGGDARAFLAIEAAPGFAFTDGYTGDVIVPSSSKGHHGFDPERAELGASLIIHGPGVHGPIQGARLIDIAPTVASWLGLALPDAQGRVLDIIESGASGL